MWVIMCLFSNASLTSLSTKWVLSWLVNEDDQIKKVIRGIGYFVHVADDFMGNDDYFEQLIESQVETESPEVAARGSQRVVKSI